MAIRFRSLTTRKSFLLWYFTRKLSMISTTKNNSTILSPKFHLKLSWSWSGSKPKAAKKADHTVVIRESAMIAKSKKRFFSGSITMRSEQVFFSLTEDYKCYGFSANYYF